MPSGCLPTTPMAERDSEIDNCRIFDLRMKLEFVDGFDMSIENAEFFFLPDPFVQMADGYLAFKRVKSLCVAERSNIWSQ